jgi:hypothetical protein
MLPSPRDLSDLLHLSDEDVVLAATQDPTLDEATRRHAARCAACERRVTLAREVLPLEPFQRTASAARVARTLDALMRAGAIPAPPSSRGFVRVAFEGSAVCILDTDARVKVAPALAVRGASAERPAAVTFQRKLGGVELELHLVRGVHEQFHLSVGAVAHDPDLRVALRRGERELGAAPLGEVGTTFRHLRPASYRLDLQRRGAFLGSLDVDVLPSEQGGERR